MEFIYSFLSDGMDRRPAYGFSHQLRPAVEKEDITPSAMDYYSEYAAKRASKSYTFGHRPRTNYVRDEDTPGPGSYFISEDYPLGMRGYTLGGRPRSRHTRSDSPGPEYFPDDAPNFHPQRGYTFGHRRQSASRRRQSATPGPGEFIESLA